MKKLYIYIMLITLVAAAFIGWYTGLFSSYASPVNETTEESEAHQPVGPAFSADSAYAFCAAQCAFGPRTMNSSAHARCGEWIQKKFEEYGCSVNIQQASLRGYDGTALKSTNIIASYNPEASVRLLLCAHWDSRPWADNDPLEANHHTPVMAANDGASGVAVMLELARLLQKDTTRLAVGIDFVCFDAEDWGTPQWADVEDDPESWALGADYWSRNLPSGYVPRYGVLLDMVGGEGAKFYEESFSKQFAPDVVKKVWRAAREAGFGSFFPKSEGGMITDDHVPVNKHGNIPCIDIIPYYPDCQQSAFGPTWHTVSDDMQHIDRNTLKAVGQTLVQLIYTEQ